MNATSEDKLSQVAPDLAARVRQMAAILISKGITIQVISGKRSTAQQAALYANRASNHYPVAAPGTSLHEKGLAVDLSKSSGTWAQVGEVGESLGLRWGGRFNKPDYPHFELVAGAVISPVIGSGITYSFDVPSLSFEEPALPASLIQAIGVLLVGLVLIRMVGD